jgi:hypothetical protein
MPARFPVWYSLLTGIGIFLTCFFGQAQSVTGIPGYIRIPTATLMQDGTLYAGTSFLPRNYLEYTNYRYDAATAFVSLTFLPFVELDFRFTRQLGLPSYESHVSDRMPSVRVRMIREKRWWPSVVLGVQDFLTSIESGDARHFQSSYLVISKGFRFYQKQWYLEGTLGYGTNWLIARNYELTGVWGGMSLTWNKVRWLTLMADYDGKVPSVGLEALLFRHLMIKAGVSGFNAFTGCVSYRIFLKK